MNKEIFDHIKKWTESKGYTCDSDEEAWETLTDVAGHVWSGDEDERRWWTEYFHVVQLDGKLIGFTDAKTTGDDSARDKGWEPDYDSVCEVEQYEVKAIGFRAIK